MKFKSKLRKKEEKEDAKKAKRMKIKKEGVERKKRSKKSGEDGDRKRGEVGGNLPLKQTSFLPIRMIESAFSTYKELDEHEQALMERNLFTESDILNAIRILSEKTLHERLDAREEWTLFEDIASDLFNAGSAKETLNDLLFNLGCDLNTHRSKLRIKGLMHFTTQEK